MPNALSNAGAASRDLTTAVRQRNNHLVLRFRELFWKGDPNALIIHQMGKVGSSSVYVTLRKYLPRRRIYHTHFLNRNRIADFVANDPATEGLQHIACSRFLVDRMDRYERLQIITLVRDPIARNVSAFFENRVKFFADKTTEEWRNHLTTLKQRFLSEYPHEIPTHWLDKEIKDVFGINVFAQPFHHAEGGMTLRSDRIEVLILRQDALNRTGARMISDFVHRKIPALESTNIGARKDYSKLYQSFLAELRFPAPYVERIYGSRYARHFFTSEEIASFRERWSQ